MIKVLAVDDCCIDLQILANTLKSEPLIELYSTKDSNVAFNMAKKIMPDLIILDVMMTETDGLTVREQLKNDADTMGIPIIFLSSMGENEQPSRFIGCYEFMQKPFNSEKLIKSIKDNRALNAIDMAITEINKMRCAS